jgi:hypothetical protein
MPFEKGKAKRFGGRKPHTPNKATAAIKELLNEILHDEALRKEWKRWLGHEDPKIAFEAFKLSQAYMFGKPVQPIVGEAELPPVRIDISAIPLKRERVN